MTSAKIANGGVSSADILNNSITSADIANGSFTGADILDDSITSADIANGSFTGADIADGSLSAADLGADSVTPPRSPPAPSARASSPPGRRLGRDRRRRRRFERARPMRRLDEIGPGRSAAQRSPTTR